jgi:hypothetical protein
MRTKIADGTQAPVQQPENSHFALTDCDFACSQYFKVLYFEDFYPAHRFALPFSFWVS